MTSLHIMSWLYIVLGSCLLYLGGEILIRSALKLASLLRLSSLTIGLTVVALGTSAPELAATLVAAFKEMDTIAFSNIVGSNIANLSLVLGFSAIITPLKPTFHFLVKEIPFMIFIGLVLFFVAIDGHITRSESLVLLLLLVIFFLIFLKHNALFPISSELEKRSIRNWKKTIYYILAAGIGVLLLSLGADLLIKGAVNLARKFGISERIIGLTLVAGGTSLPELASSLVAAYRKAEQIILGNLIGSNIMNILVVLACTSLIKPLSFLKENVFFDLLTMIILSIFTWVLLLGNSKFGRIKGLILLTLYIIYIFFLYAKF